MGVAVVIMVAVIMMMVLMIVVLVIVVRMHYARRISPAFWLKRSFNPGDFPAQRLDQGGKRFIALQSQPGGEKLDRNVPIAQRPGNARESREIGPNLEQCLGCCDYFDDIAVVQQQAVVGLQGDRIRETEFDPRALAPNHHGSGIAPVRGRQDQRVDWTHASCSGSNELHRARHGTNLVETGRSFFRPVLRHNGCLCGLRWHIPCRRRRSRGGLRILLQMVLVGHPAERQAH